MNKGICGSMSRRELSLILPSALLSLLLGGCFVSPKAIDPEELLQLLESDRELIISSQIPVDAPLSLSDVMARSVLSNLEQRVSNLEESVALGAYEIAKYDML